MYPLSRNPAGDAADKLLSAALAALADPTRRAILARLALGETRVGDLIKPFPISGPAISRHLRVLENAQLIERKVDAQWRVCRLNPPGLRVADDWLSQYRAYWEHSLDRLVDVLEQGDGPAPAPPRATGATPHAARKSGARHARKTGKLPSTRNRKSP